MKRLLAPATRKMLTVLGIAILAAVPALAQQGNWNVDSEHSTAAIFLGSKAADLQNIGVVRVSGNAVFDSDNPAKSVLKLNAVLPDDQWMTFQSKHIDMLADGRLQVSGEMALSRIEHDATYNPGEDYYGPIYGASMVSTVTREVAFVVSPENKAGQEAEITAETTLGIENFPELFARLRQAAWPPVVQDQVCQIPQAGEDYRGAECSGNFVAPGYQLAAIRTGEDYRGDESPAPSGNLMKLVLRLQLS
jgi:hypothetical protein